MEIISNKEEYLKYYFNLAIILDDKEYRNIRNEHYNPDLYIGLLDRSNSIFIPLVSKNNLVTFFGGILYNENNIIPQNYINNVIDSLLEKKLSFKLLSINNDIFNELNENYKKYDVPYTNKWFIDFEKFDLENYYNTSKIKSDHISKRIRLSLNRKDYYKLQCINEDYKLYIDDIIDKISLRFLEKDKVYSWNENKDLLLNILSFFQKKSELLFYILKNDEKMIGWFCCINNGNGKFTNLIFNIISKFYKHDVIILFMKMQEILKDNNCKFFDFMNGSFGYKDICGCDYQPVFALVNDENWKIQYNSNVDKDKVIQKINRDFGCFSNI